jgi:hypothetical protein
MIPKQDGPIGTDGPPDRLITREALLLAAAIAAWDALPDLLLFPTVWAPTLQTAACGFLVALLLAAAVTTARARLRRYWVGAAIAAVALAVLAQSALNVSLLSLAGRGDVGVEGYALPQTREQVRMMFFVSLDLYAWFYGFYAMALGLLMAQRATLESRARLSVAELEVLRLQLAPHFLMNAFNSLLSLVERDRKPEATEMIFRMSSFFRAVLLSDLSRLVPLRDEMDNLHDYFAIEQSWVGDRVNMEVHIPPEADRAAVPPQILQPLVENVVHHVVAATNQPVTIRLAARVVERRLEIDISNTLPADWAPSHRGTGLGQKNVADRLTHLYGPHATLEAERRPDGYEVRIRIPHRLAATSADGRRAAKA